MVNKRAAHVCKQGLNSVTHVVTLLKLMIPAAKTKKAHGSQPHALKHLTPFLAVPLQGLETLFATLDELGSCDNPPPLSCADTVQLVKKHANNPYFQCLVKIWDAKTNQQSETRPGGGSNRLIDTTFP